MNNNVFDLVIIGAGINGAGIFRDAALNKLKVLLVDSLDFCTQTSARSSKMLHGGIRYLQHLDFELVHGALQEKNLWLKLAPSLARSQSFILPLYEDSSIHPWELYLGLKLYDALAGFPSPHPHFLTKRSAMEKVPQLKAEKMRGAGLYYDAVVDDKALALLCIQSALRSQNASVSAHTKITGLDTKNHTIEVRLKKNEEDITVFTHDLCFCTGPFTDSLLPSLGLHWKNTLALSKGSHLWITKEALALSHAVVMQDKKGRVIFAIPYPDKILVGTTELPLEKHDPLFDITITDEEVSYLLERLQFYFPRSAVSQKHILSTFCGIRPLVATGNSALGAISRHHHVFHPHPQISVLLGGKYTTFRTMGQDILSYVCKRQARPYNRNLTLSPLT